MHILQRCMVHPSMHSLRLRGIQTQCIMKDFINIAWVRKVSVSPFSKCNEEGKGSWSRSHFWGEINTFTINRNNRSIHNNTGRTAEQKSTVINLLCCYTPSGLTRLFMFSFSWSFWKLWGPEFKPMASFQVKKAQDWFISTQMPHFAASK